MLNRRGGVIQSTIYAVHCSRFVNPLPSPSPPLIPFNLLPLPIPRFVPQFSIRIEIYSFTHSWLKVSRDNIFEEGRVILDVESINNVENSAGDSLDSFTFEKSFFPRRRSKERQGCETITFRRGSKTDLRTR